MPKLIAVILFASCMAESYEKPTAPLPEKLTFITTALRDSLGNVSFSLPQRFDTSFTWTNRSDCGKPCNYEQYRFQNKNFPIFKESGFYYNKPDILIDQFTIIHSGYFPFREVDTSKQIGRHEKFKSRLSNDPSNGAIVSDTIEKINDRYFSVVHMSGFDRERQKHFAKTASLTTIKGNEIEFHYEFKRKDSINLKDLYENSLRFLRTVRISNGI